MSIPTYITLMGAEDVSRASGGMQTAASEMTRAAGYFDDVMRRQQQFMDDWLCRFEAALIQHEKDGRA
jgi:hypothetical protein